MSMKSSGIGDRPLKMLESWKLRISLLAHWIGKYLVLANRSVLLYPLIYYAPPGWQFAIEVL
jgi:hypothetical protein